DQRLARARLADAGVRLNVRLIHTMRCPDDLENGSNSRSPTRWWDRGRRGGPDRDEEPTLALDLSSLPAALDGPVNIAWHLHAMAARQPHTLAVVVPE